VIIPALNEAGNIYSLVQEVLAILPGDVVVVDNGSTDTTAADARSAGARVISEPRRGYGYACAAGAAACPDSDILVFLDGDYSYFPADLPQIIAPVQAGEAELCLGSRFRGGIDPGAMPSHQRFGNWTVSRLTSLFYRISITDLGPFRAVRRDWLLNLEMHEMTYGWPTEMLVKTARRGGRIVEAPVGYHNRREGKSKVSGTLRGSLLAAWYILVVTLRYA
jgi:glycosyltransferase involved in cell wall biosynthesis